MDKVSRIDPYSVPEDQQGWRGLGLPGNSKRKVYTILHNEQVLVTALLLIPGERSIRHSHETGELSIHYSSEIKPIVSWNPPGLVHGPPVAPSPGQGSNAEAPYKEPGSDSTLPEVARLIMQMGQLQGQIEQLQQAVQELRRPQPSPRIIIDILFPPFKTTIDDPAYPEKKTIVGQWYD